MQELVTGLAETPVARLHDIESLMGRLKLGRSTVFAILGSGELRSMKVGRRRLVSEAALVDFIERLEAADADTGAALDDETATQRTDRPRPVTA